MEFVTVSTDSGVTFITMNRPELHNAFNNQMIGEMTEAFRAAGGDHQCRVVVLQAEGKNFSAGADLNWMKSMAALSREQNQSDAMQLAELMHTVYTLPKMVIAKVQGASFGGALGLISACDVAFAAQGAKFCLSEVKIGLAPAVISPYVVEAIGLRNARRYMLSAEVFDAGKAHALGLIQEHYDSIESLDAAVASLAKQVAQNGPQAVAQCKQLIRDIAYQPIGDQTKILTANLIAEIRVSEEGQEGLSAFLQKRTPAWQESGLDQAAGK